MKDTAAKSKLSRITTKPGPVTILSKSALAAFAKSRGLGVSSK